MDERKTEDATLMHEDTMEKLIDATLEGWRKSAKKYIEKHPEFKDRLMHKIELRKD